MIKFEYNKGKCLIKGDLPMELIDPEAFEYALSKLDNGKIFEEFVNSFLSEILGHTFIPVGGLKDRGIDFVSVLENKFYQIQVKTSKFQKGSYFWFDLHKNKIVYSKNTYYVFVCKSLGRRRFMNKKHNFFIIYVYTNSHAPFETKGLFIFNCRSLKRYSTRH